MLNYVPPEGATEVSAQRARALCNLRKNKWNKQELARHAGEETLGGLVEKHDPDRRRFQSKSVLHNEEFLIALILDGEGRGDAVPGWWRQPVASLGNSKKRSRPEFAHSNDGTANPVQPQRQKIDLTDAGR